MNKIILIGRITRDVELRYTTSNTPIAHFNLAIPRNFKNENGEYDADFINCISFGKMAETIKNHVLKGDKLGVEGRLQTRNYDGQDGKKVYVTEVICNEIEFLTPKRKDEEKSQEEVKVENDPFANFQGVIEFQDEEGLPF